MLYFGNPDDHGRRANFSIHSSSDCGLLWESVSDVFAGGAAYSDLSITRQGDIAFVAEENFPAGGGEGEKLAEGAGQENRNSRRGVVCLRIGRGCLASRFEVRAVLAPRGMLFAGLTLR